MLWFESSDILKGSKTYGRMGKRFNAFESSDILKGSKTSML